MATESKPAKMALQSKPTKPPKLMKTLKPTKKPAKYPDNISPKTALTSSSQFLLSLGELVQGTVLRRPSQHIKSPYVADVKLDVRPHMSPP